jgi:cation-transporting ATPase E
MEITGLTHQEVKERTLKGLINKSAKKKTKTINQIFIENVFSLFNFIIFGIVLGVLFFYIRTQNTDLLKDSIGIFLVAFINTFIAIYQEIKAKRALDKVSLLLKKKSSVVRDGQLIELEINEIVKDDIIFLKRGDQIVTDGCIINSNHLEIDESLLTGESVPIYKIENDTVLSGSFCVSGSGYYRTDKIGDESYANKVTNLAKKYKILLTPLQKKINLIVKLLFIAAIFLCIAEIFINNSSDIQNTVFIRKIATILISLVPQGLVLMSSVTFALGVYRISKIGAIIQKLNAVESFSNIKVVCMDKTGTLTMNKLVVEYVNYIDNMVDNNSYINYYIKSFSNSITDCNATINAIKDNINNIETSENFSFEKIDEIPFSSDLKYSIIRAKINNEEKIFILGGYDVILEKVADGKKENILNLIKSKELASYRNLIFGEVISEMAFSTEKEYLSSIKIIPEALFSMSDKIREDVSNAITLFRENNIQLKILSGDAGEAVLNITNKIGWKTNSDDLITGKELEEIDDLQYKEIIKKKSIFARLKPEQKLKIIKTLRKEKIYTAMIGDGVNDLPAIKEADMGIAMEEGSQITKEISDIVLLKNKFSLLPEIFNEGNKIVNTVSSIAKLFLTKNFLVIFSTLISLIFTWQFVLTPRRVSLINIFIIGLPSLMVALKNTDISKNKAFFIELFSFVIISSLFIIFSSYLTANIIKNEINISEQHLTGMIILTSFIIISISNFYSVTLKKSTAKKGQYVLFGLLLAVLYCSLVYIKTDFILHKFIKDFYEINTVELFILKYVLLISVAFSILLYIIQTLRSKIISKLAK